MEQAVCFSEDNGVNYGRKAYVDIVAHSQKDEELELLVNKIHTELSLVRVGDWGGGNGILANRLLELCSSSISGIDIIDIDDTKFISRQKINNIRADARIYSPRKKFDYSVMRNVLHYLNSLEQTKFINNILKNTSKYSLITNVIYPEDNIIRLFEDKLFRMKGIYRNFPSYESIKHTIQECGKIAESKVLSIKNFDYFNFYTSRFNMNDDEAELLFNTGMPKIGEYQAAVFLCSYE